MSITHIMWYLHCGLVAYLVHLIGKKIIQERIDIQERANMRESTERDNAFAFGGHGKFSDSQRVGLGKSKSMRLLGGWVESRFRV